MAERREVAVMVDDGGTVHVLGPPDCVEAVQRAVDEAARLRVLLDDAAQYGSSFYWRQTLKDDVMEALGWQTWPR